MSIAITIHFWVFALLPLVVGSIIGIAITSLADSYDFVSPLIGLAVFFIGLFFTAGILIGHFL